MNKKKTSEADKKAIRILYDAKHIEVVYALKKRIAQLKKQNKKLQDEHKN